MKPNMREEILKQLLTRYINGESLTDEEWVELRGMTVTNIETLKNNQYRPCGHNESSAGTALNQFNERMRRSGLKLGVKS